jgi:hypothetical protein
MNIIRFDTDCRLISLFAMKERKKEKERNEENIVRRSIFHSSLQSTPFRRNVNLLMNRVTVPPGCMYNGTTPTTKVGSVHDG